MFTHSQLVKEWRENNQGFDTIIEYISYRIMLVREKGSAITYMDEQGIIHKHEGINHFPQLKEYEIWMEGFKTKDNEIVQASLVTILYARNFAQACHMAMCEAFLRYCTKVNDPSFDGYAEVGWTYSPKMLTDWGCRLFWNEQMARKSFG